MFEIIFFFTFCKNAFFYIFKFFLHMNTYEYIFLKLLKILNQILARYITCPYEKINKNSMRESN